MCRTKTGLLIVVLLGNAACNSGESGESDASKIHGALLSNEKDFPSTLADTKVFHDGNPDKPVFGVTKYEVKVPLWSDGARKTRYVFVPPGSKLKYDMASGKLEYPIGTTFIKHFTTETDPQLPVETRMITLKNDNQWHFVTYVWADDGSTEVNVRPRKVTKGDKEYRIPSEQECKMCHGDPGTILGFNLRQLNFDVTEGQNQLALLTKSALFESPLDELAKVKALDDPQDTNLSINARARAYMDVNCSTCHHPGGPEKANKLDLRLDAIDTKLRSEGKVVPGNLEESILWKLVSSETERMPLISLRPDPAGIDILKQMIEQWPK